MSNHSTGHPPDMPENTGDSALFRDQMRKNLLAVRAALPSPLREQYAEHVCSHLRTVLLSSEIPEATARSIGFCLPWRDECDLRPLLADLSRAAWQVSVPVVVAPGVPMRFRTWQPDSPLTRDRHGIAIPDTPECAPPAVLLLPVVGVDRQGYRLGYGGGYFDRTLAALTAQGTRPYCVGVGFTLCKIDDLHPADHDQPLDLLVTEQGATRFDTGALDGSP